MWIYIGFSILWGIFATRMHLKLYRKNNAILCFIFNTVGAPIAMIMAIVNCPVE